MEENNINTYIIPDARIGAFTQQVLDCVKIAMLGSPHNWRPTAVVLDTTKPNTSFISVVHHHAAT